MAASLRAKLPPPGCPPLPQHLQKQDNADELHIWLSPLVPSPFDAKSNAALPAHEQTDRWLQQLDLPLLPHIRDRLAHFRHPHLQSQRIAGLGLVCTALHCLAGIPPTETLTALAYDASGDASGDTSGCPRLRFSPSRIAPETSWRVSFSYASGWAACALRSLPTEATPTFIPALGVDVEHAPLQGQPEHFAAVFNPEEQQAIATASDSEDERARRWTGKEAALKALGCGFSYDPRIITTHSPMYTTLPLVSAEACFPSHQALHRTRIAASVHPPLSAQELFWQCIALEPHTWLSVASFPAWEKTRISFLRLA